MVSAPTALALTAATLGVVTLLGLAYARGRVGSIESYLTARNTAGEGLTTATVIASGMGAWILLSPAEAGAAFGGLSAVIGYAVGSALPLLVYVSVGTRIRRLLPEGHSLTEYALARYGPWMYAYVLVISVLYMFVALAAEMTGIAGALGLVAGVPAWQTAALIGGFVVVYTGYGGLVASIFTDAIQTLLVLPLLAVGFAGAILSMGGPRAIHAQVASTNPGLLDPGYLPGVAFGAYVMIAITGASLLNQGQWQRVFAARDAATVRRSFALAALAVVPMVFLAGLFGVAAAGLGLLEDGSASIAFFLVLRSAFPEWVALVVVMLAVLLVMSTADTLFNGLVSVVVVDLARLVDADSGRLRPAARALTVVVALAATIVGAQGYSVLSLFLTADLLAAATAAPFLHGLYSERATEPGAVLASVVGLLVGLAYFPTLRPLLSALPVVGPALPGTSFLYAFAGAAAVSVGLTLAAARLLPGRFDLGRLAHEVRALDEPMTDGGTGADR